MARRQTAKGAEHSLMAHRWLTCSDVLARADDVIE
jgi:hypothetical protein